MSLITQKIERAVEMRMIARKEKEFDADAKRYLAWDNHYAREGDVDLTEEQKAEIDAFWSKYEFAFKVNYDTFKVYMNRTGKFDPRYIPYGVRRGFIASHIRNDDYRWAFQNKAYFPNIYPNVKQPRMICRRLEGLFYDGNFNRITFKRVVELCLKALEKTEIVIKPSTLSGGKGVVFLSSATEETLREEFRKIEGIVVVQEAIKQHPDIAKLNPSTVNTIRLTTYMTNRKVVPLAALMKIGNAGVRVDNYKHGGHILGVNLDGTAYPYALNVDYERVTVLPTGVDLSEGFQVPGFDSVLKTAAKAHNCTPQVKVISWDIAIDQDAKAVIIEGNHGGDFRMHQVITGPLLGDDTEAFLDRFLVKKFFRERANKDWNFNEYFEEVRLTKYAGTDKDVVIPETINGKPVTVISRDTFRKNSKIVSVTIPATLRTIQKAAFHDCSKLETVTGGGSSLQNIDVEAFRNTPNLNRKTVAKLRKLAKQNKLEAAAASSESAE